MTSRDKPLRVLTDATPGELNQAKWDVACGAISIEYILRPEVWPAFYAWVLEHTRSLRDEDEVRLSFDQAADHLTDIGEAADAVLRGLQ